MKKFLGRNHVVSIALIVMSLILVNTSYGQGTQTFSTPGTFTNGFTVPAGVTSITVEVWGGGGKGGSVVNNTIETGGGGGGAYSRSVITVVPGNSFSYTVGGGSTTTAAGGDSWFGSATTVMAKGGNSVPNATAAGATGGAAASGFGTVKFNGGNGANSTDATFGGGGGSSAGTAAAGNFTNTTTSQAAGATAPTGGGNGGAGGSGSPSNGTAGSAPGGGGGGVRSTGTTTQNGGNGANGQVKITWTCPSATISYPSTTSLFCKTNTSITPTITGTSGGTFSATPAGLSLVTGTGVINPSTSTAANYTVHYQIASGGNGCTAVDATAAISIFAIPTTSFTKNDLQCFNVSTGQITVTGNGGISPYTYSLDNGTNYSSPVPTGTFNNLSAGTYKIRVKDSKGCESRSVQ